MTNVSRRSSSSSNSANHQATHSDIHHDHEAAYQGAAANKKTAIGDVELTERSYPVVIHQFSRRKDTGGEGRHKGGDGCIREIEFTTDLDVAILSQRRVVPPYGMKGGGEGSRGKNQWYKRVRGDGGKRKQGANGNQGHGDGDSVHGHEDYQIVNLGGSNQCRMAAGDRIIIRESHLRTSCSSRSR